MDTAVLGVAQSILVDPSRTRLDDVLFQDARAIREVRQLVLLWDVHGNIDHFGTHIIPSIQNCTLLKHFNISVVKNNDSRV